MLIRSDNLDKLSYTGKSVPTKRISVTDFIISDVAIVENIQLYTESSLENYLTIVRLWSRFHSKTFFVFPFFDKIIWSIPRKRVLTRFLSSSPNFGIVF